MDCCFGDVSVAHHSIIGSYFSSPLTFYTAWTPASPSTTALGSPSFGFVGGIDAYIAKYNSNGVLQWAARLAGSGWVGLILMFWLLLIFFVLGLW